MLCQQRAVGHLSVNMHYQVNLSQCLVQWIYGREFISMTEFKPCSMFSQNLVGWENNFCLVEYDDAE